MTKAQARRAYVLLHDTEVYRIGDHPRRVHDPVVWAIWTVIGLVSGAVLAGGAFLVWLGVHAIGRALGW